MALGSYVVSRTAGRFALLLAVFIGVIAGGQIAIAMRQGVPPDALGPALAGMAMLALPIALPLALTTAVLVTISAMARDGELRALAACGISEVSVIAKLWPLVMAGILLSSVLSHVVMPEAMGVIRANKGRFYQAGIAYRVGAQRSFVNEQGVSAWARTAAGKTLQDIYVVHSDEKAHTTLHANDAGWYLGRTGSEDGLGIEMRDVRALRRFTDGRIQTAEMPRAHYAVLDRTPAQDQQDNPDSQSTARVLERVRTWRPLELVDGKQVGQKHNVLNNARLTLHLRFYTPIALVIFVIFAAGLALILPTADNLLGVIIVMVIVAGSTVPAIMFVKSSVDHPQMSPAILLWPPAGVLLALGVAILLRPDRAREIAGRPLAVVQGLITRVRKSAVVGIRYAFRFAFARGDVDHPTKRAAPVAKAVTVHPLGTLDRFILRRILMRWIGVLFIGVFLIALGDFLGKLGQYLLAVGNHPLLYLQYLAYRLPDFASLWLPLSCLTAGMLVSGPMLRQGTIMMLSSSGIAPRRVFRVLLPFAIGVGALSFLLNDQVLPRTGPLAEELEERMTVRVKKPGQASKVPAGRPAGWRVADTFWVARDGKPASGSFSGVTAFHGEGAVSLAADSLDWVEGAWWLTGAVVVTPSRQVRYDRCTPDEVGFPIGRDRRALALELRPEQNKTSGQLLRAPSERSWRVIAGRILASFTPLLCLLIALPRFTRWENRQRIGATTAWTLIQGLMPVAAMVIAQRVIIGSELNPLLLAGVIGATFLALGAWRWARMRV